MPAVVVLGPLIAILLLACDEHTEIQPPPPAVTVAPAKLTEVRRTVEYVGRVAAREHVELRARVTGFLEQRAFIEGQDVDEGMVLFKIESSSYRAAVNEAQARLAQAQATFKNAERNLKRQAELVKRGTVSESIYDGALAARDEARAAAQAREAELETAKLDLGYTTITAPFAGRMGRATFSKGDLVGPESGALATIVEVDPIHVYFSASERRLLEVQKRHGFTRGKEGIKTSVVVTLRLSDGTQYGQVGRIDFVDNIIDRSTGSIAARAIFPNPDSLLTPNQFVTLILEQDKPEQAITVPQAAVQEDQKGRYVLVVDDQNRVRQRRIETGQQAGTDWVVLSGLEAGELVIVEGLQKVHAGGQVNPGAEGP